jgi:hypothetical protein
MLLNFVVDMAWLSGRWWWPFTRPNLAWIHFLYWNYWYVVRCWWPPSLGDHVVLASKVVSLKFTILWPVSILCSATVYYFLFAPFGRGISHFWSIVLMLYLANNLLILPQADWKYGIMVIPVDFFLCILYSCVMWIFLCCSHFWKCIL